ncbi:hypothetical protein [Staphylococcus aureus]|uniref:hypothetical protein n=1 Tax=Staphylococcus aureus TaxID=1280 RepID=UPI001654A8FE|nr:hypothetical protein [Staphylococcus aureus]HDK4771676.1 hypothetical protein [Staphylococcus aureus]HDK4782612.1 hypothetical protein [Staphylococcus aureus]
MRDFEDIMFVAEDIYSYFSKLSRENARNASEQWDISEAHSQSGTLALCLENISKNIEDYSAEELSKMIYSISKAQREIFKLI